MPWTHDEEGRAELSEDGGAFRKRIAPRKDGRFAVESFSYGSWNRGESYPTEAEARGEIEDMLEHRIELRTMPRPELDVHGKGVRTIWGVADHAVSYGEGVICYGTPGHGGFKLDAKRNRQVHPALRIAGGSYEEDCNWAIVAHTFPEMFTQRERTSARKTLIEWLPHGYMAATGTVVTEAMSGALRRENFAARHAKDWVVVSAKSHDDRHVLVCAVIGGRAVDPMLETEEKLFLVPNAEYAARDGNFAIDLARHEEFATAPSPSL